MAYDLWSRKLTPANWARRSTLPVAFTTPQDLFSTSKAKAEIRTIKQLKLAADRGDPVAKHLWAKKLGFLRDMKTRAAGGYPDSAHCKRVIAALSAQGIVVAGWSQGSVSCGTRRSSRTVKGEIIDGRRISVVGGPDDPLTKLPAKERTTVAKLIVLRKKADAGDASSQRIVETVARLQIFVVPPGLTATNEQQYMVHGKGC